jgi:hypothetical protein
MFGSFWRTLGATSFVLALTGCGGGRIEAWEKATGDRNLSLQGSADLLGVTVPVLRSHGLERVWGAPKIQRDGKGGYVLTYADPKKPFTRLMVHGMTEPLPKLSSPPLVGGEHMVNDNLTGYQKEQEWRKVTVLGEEVRWFQESASGGADGAYFSTEGFSRKAPDGRKGYFRLVAEHGDTASGDVARWFGSVSF